VFCQLSREYSPADGALQGAEPAHSTAGIPYTTQRDAILQGPQADLETMSLGTLLQRGPDHLDLGIVQLGRTTGSRTPSQGRSTALLPRPPPTPHTFGTHTPTALAISAFETPFSNNSTARTRRASANRGRDKGGREAPAAEGEGR
jgi:hypothetical protein